MMQATFWFFGTRGLHGEVNITYSSIIIVDYQTHTVGILKRILLSAGTGVGEIFVGALKKSTVKWTVQHGTVQEHVLDKCTVCPD